MKKINWLWYFIYALALACYIIFSSNILTLVNKQNDMTFNGLPLMIWSTIIFIVLGLLLGLESFLLEMGKEGEWKINLPKVVFLGLPSLYFSMATFIYYYSPDFIKPLSFPSLFFIVNKTNFISIFKIILGYTIITSFVKVKGHYYK